VIARFGPFVVGREDGVFADDDGVVFVPLSRAPEVLGVAARIRDTEKRQAERARSGIRLRDQLRFSEYLEARSREPGRTFRDHLREIGGAIEE